MTLGSTLPVNLAMLYINFRMGRSPEAVGRRAFYFAQRSGGSQWTQYGIPSKIMQNRQDQGNQFWSLLGHDLASRC